MKNSFYKNLTHRTELVIGTENIERLYRSNILIVGVGGVGSWCAEALVRSGVVNLTIVDSDIICTTNINRQAQANSKSVGKLKVNEMKKRLLEINPDANILAINKAFTEENHAEFEIEKYDYIIDAIDSIKHKVFLIEICQRLKKKFISSMGAGARTNPLKIKVAKLEKTVNCALASIVRKRLRQKRLKVNFLCVYSDEVPVKPAIAAMCAGGDCVCNCDREKINSEENSNAIDWCSMKKQINGALVHITGVFGFTMAGIVIQDLIKG